MVQKKFNVFQAVFYFVLMYTAIVSGILLREYSITSVGVGGYCNSSITNAETKK